MVLQKWWNLQAKSPNIQNPIRASTIAKPVNLLHLLSVFNLKLAYSEAKKEASKSRQNRGKQHTLWSGRELLALFWEQSSDSRFQIRIWVSELTPKFPIKAYTRIFTFPQIPKMKQNKYIAETRKMTGVGSFNLNVIWSRLNCEHSRRISLGYKV